MYNAKLSKLYENYNLSWKSALNEGAVTEELLDRLSCPLLLHVKDEAWGRSAGKILFVGQETNDWAVRDESGYRLETLHDFLSDSGSIPSLQKLYEGFAFGANYTRSPFWQAFNAVKAAEVSSSVLWTNLFRFCFQRGSVRNGSGQEYKQISELNFGILAEEIRILEPTAVIFVTGPYYDEEIKHSFPSAVLSEFSSRFKTRAVARIEHEDLPIASFRTYHPNYLRRASKWEMLDCILAKIK